MPSLQRFEGPELEAILEQVYETCGSDVTIAEANRVRRGGVGGFFSKELYEVVVEIDDEPTLSIADVPKAFPRPAARSVLDLVDLVEDNAMASPDTVADLVRRTGGGIINEVRRSDGAEQHEPPLSDTGAVQSPQTMTAAELFASAKSAAPHHHLPESHMPSPPPGPRLSTDSEGFADVLGRLARQTVAAPAPEAEPADAPTEPFVQFGDASQHAAPAASPLATADHRRGRVIRPNRAAVEPVAPTMHVPALPFTTADLIPLGMPMHYLRDELVNTEQLAALLEISSRLPIAAPLPSRGDAVIALIGDWPGLVEAANHINELLGLNPDRLMVATRRENKKVPDHQRIASIDEAAIQRRNWRRREQPTVVLIDEPMSRVRTTWTRHLLAALEPSSTWGVIEATRKPEDIEDWVERLGGIDAIATFGSEETTSPAAVLTTGIPVSMLDGRAATAARWAAVLDERLYAA